MDTATAAAGSDPSGKTARVADSRLAAGGAELGAQGRREVLVAPLHGGEPSVRRFTFR